MLKLVRFREQDYLDYADTLFGESWNELTTHMWSYQSVYFDISVYREMNQ